MILLGMASPEKNGHQNRITMKIQMNCPKLRRYALHIWVASNLQHYIKKTVSIEFATKKDVKAAFALLSRCKDNLIEQGIFQWNAEYPKLEYVENDITKGSLAKLTNSDQLVGVISFDDFQEPEYKTVNWKINCDSIAVIHRLAVDPLLQGRGFAKKLMDFAEKSISRSGFQAIRLDAYSGNEMLLRFYDKFGYKSVGEIYFPSRNLPFICMEKSIKI